MRTVWLIIVVVIVAGALLFGGANPFGTQPVLLAVIALTLAFWFVADGDRHILEQRAQQQRDARAVPPPKGVPNAPESQPCRQCGKFIARDAATCRHCGAPQA